MTDARINVRIQTCIGREETVTVTDVTEPLSGAWEGSCSLAMSSTHKVFFGKYTNMEVRVALTLPCTPDRVNSGDAAEHAAALLQHAAHTVLTHQADMFSKYLDALGAEV